MILRMTVLWVFTSLMLTSTPASAHSLSVAYVDISVPTDGSAPVIEYDVSVRDLALAVPLDANRDEEVTWGEVLEARGHLESLARTGLSLTSLEGPCALELDTLGIRRYDEGAFVALRFEADCPGTRGLRFQYDALVDQDRQHRAVVTSRRGGETATAILTHANPQLEIGNVGTRAAPSPFSVFLREGLHHILIGYDHLAFLVCLLLPAALVRDRDTWRPGEGLRRGLFGVLGIVTAFTVAHSITLSLAALGWVTPHARAVELAIAGTVILAALNNVWPVVVRRVWLVGFVFGLIHGFGFAGALGELQMPKDARLWSLLGFNLGVEAGQVVVVCVLLPVLFAVRKRRWYASVVLPAVSLGIAVLAACWFWQRWQG